MQKQILNRMLYGGDYNPEQWPKEIWEEDMRLFKKAHINSASINIFAWAKLQSSETDYHFEDLDEVVALLSEEGHDIVMATSTASLPAWLTRKYPDVNRTDFEGRKHRFSHRHNHCPNSPSFQKYASALVARLAERYANHPQVKVWHVSNEYNGECYCDNCEKAFRVWLKNKYHSIEAVNTAWNLNFWGHTVYSFDDIVVPNYLGDGVSDRQTAFAGLSVDYRRFMSESLLNNYKMERDIIKKYAPEAPVTTNLMGTFKGLDSFAWAKEMDIISWDNYPHYEPDWAFTSLSHDLMRGLKNGQSFMLMESSPSQQNWMPYNVLKKPGQLRSISYHAVAHGADTVQYFQLRQSIGGNEKFHGSVISHAGHENTRVFKEVTEIGVESEKLSDSIVGATTPARVGILFDWDNYWALEYTSGPNVDLYYVNQILHYYRYFHQNNIPIDMLGYDADFSAYDVVVAPVLYMIKDDIVERLEQFVENGGHFVTTFMSGIVDQSDNVILGGYPGPLRKLLGIWVEEIDALTPNQSNHIVSVSAAKENKEYSGSLVSDILHLEGAEAVMVYDDNFYTGSPVVTVNNFGKGKAWYIGTLPNENLRDTILNEIVDLQNIQSLGHTPENVELSIRSKNGQDFIFVINHNSEAVSFDADYAGCTDLLTDTTVENELNLPAFGVMILSKL
ncbi:beta-galactosidase [Fundicoccus sp. Sow4_H7]|uniref:beta-galactosidase n=1 Tax=Fundicoccus sp. Sow4_H7 TaxID=3438784 RepID=UPI003F932578